MKLQQFKLIFIPLLIFLLTSFIPSSSQLRTLYNSLDPLSIAQHLALYELYPDSDEGKRALNDAWRLLNHSQTNSNELINSDSLSPFAINAVVSLVNKHSDEPIPELSENELLFIEKLASNFPNRKLKGHLAQSEDDVLRLPQEEIDLARGLFLTQLGNNALNKVRTYEAMIDLMALQIRAKLPPTPTPQQQIRAINDFIFSDMGFRFPPHSLYAKDIDVYTFLPSVLDGRRGVCLGVSILYICLAQRLGLNLEMITPPGHIYVRYKQPNTEEINIETTARGIHVDSDEYLSISTCALQQRNIKEVIGLAHFNQASVFWTQKKYQDALNSYQKALPYLHDDALLKELMGYNFLFVGDLDRGTALLKEIKDHKPTYSIKRDTVTEDFLNGYADAEAIKTIFMHVDEKRDSILQKRDALLDITKKWPHFRMGWLSLAVTWLQLYRLGEALEILEKYHTLDNEDPEAEYYLTALYAQRIDYEKAWKSFRNLERILKQNNYQPKLLKEIKIELSSLFPE